MTRKANRPAPEAAPTAGAGSGRADPVAPANVLEVPRRLLLDRLRRRWEVPVAVVVAPGGFGKSTLLRQAFESDGAAFGHQHLVTLTEFDLDPVRLAGLLAVALGTRETPRGGQRASPAAAVVAAIGRQSPRQVCLMIDEVQLLADDDTSAAREVLAALLRDLPGNGHLVLCGRSLPDLPELATRRPGLLITEDDLRFGPEEIAELALRHGADIDAFGHVPGWPALVRLAIAAGEEASIDYLREEVLDALDPDTRLALAATVVAGTADTALLEAVAPGTSPGALAARVPLVDLRADGVAAAHALWTDVADLIVDDATRRRLVVDVARGWARAGRHDDAVQLAAAHGDADLFASLVMRAIGSAAVAVGAGVVDRWLSSVPPAEIERPEVLVLRGLRDRLGRDHTQGEELFERAREAFVASGDEAYEAVCLAQLTWTRWARGDVGGILAVYRRAKELEPRHPATLGPLVRLVEAAGADLAGDPERAIAVLEEIDLGDGTDPAMRALALNWLASLHVLTGDADEAVRATRRAVELSRQHGGRPMQVVLAHWFAGDPLGAVVGQRTWSAAADELSARDRFLAEVYDAVFAASFGRHRAVDVDELRRRGSGHGRDLVFAAMAAGAQRVVVGDESGARALLLDALDRAGPEDPLALGELRRFLGWALVLVPEERSTLLAGPMGPTHRRNQALADMLLAVRAGAEVDWEQLPPAGAVFCALPLRWSLELCAAAHDGAGAGGLDVVDLALDLAPAETLSLLDEMAGSGSGAARRLRDAVPRPPESPLTVTVLGGREVSRDGRAADGPDARRGRVRQLLALLVARRQVTRTEAAAALWPDADVDRADRNLSDTLRRLRRVLEPDLGRGQPSFFVRGRGDRLALCGGDHLRVDLWRAQDLADRAAVAERSGDLAGAAALLDEAVGLWQGDPLPSLSSVPAAAADVLRAERLLVDATARAGELYLALHDVDRARTAGRRLLDHDPADERAHRLLIASEMLAGSADAARAAMLACERALASAGMEVGAETRALARPLPR